MIETPDIRVIATNARPDYGLAITYADGCEITVDLSDVILRGGAFKALQDKRLFSLVKPSPCGDGIEWPEPKDRHGEPLISIDAESIYWAFANYVAIDPHRRLA
jgi:hypothetical protein